MPGQSGTETRQRVKNVRVRMLPEERAHIEKKARLAGVSLSQFVREAAMRRQIRAHADRKAVTDLNRVGGLLKWWLVDGKGKDGERHRRGKAPPERVPDIERLLDDIERAILRIASGDDEGGDTECDAR